MRENGGWAGPVCNKIRAPFATRESEWPGVAAFEIVGQIFMPI